jgi:hypothetical protein
MTFDAFDTVTIQTSRTSIFARWGGSGPPVLLLHGFPETHLMWRTVAPRLARDFTVICPDLPGYGRSGAAGRTTSGATPSRRGTSSPRSVRTRPPNGCASSWSQRSSKILMASSPTWPGTAEAMRLLIPSSGETVEIDGIVRGEEQGARYPGHLERLTGR